MDSSKKEEIIDRVQLVECPRDAMQGWKTFIPTEKKVEYLNALLEVGFDTLDFGSFVSALAIPQMADTPDVLARLNPGDSKTKLLAIVANIRGAQEASVHEKIDSLGYPFSVSETFQRRNTNRSMEQSVEIAGAIHQICLGKGKKLVIYLSMGFGNPYGDPWSEDILFHWANHFAGLGVHTISLADTVGLATPEQVAFATGYLIRQLPGHQIGVHLHSRPQDWKAKVEAALHAGCRRFDGALKGIGGCPMANDELVGNIDTELMMAYFQQLGLIPSSNPAALTRSIRLAEEIFNYS
jgi:hydroxymethylglutaryl-CoA lyase